MSTPPSLADLVVIGDASIDHYIRVPHLAQNDNKAIGGYLGALGGGMSANLAAAAAALGAKTRLITKVGVDPEGTEALQILQSLGVETSFSVRDYSHRTWLCFIQLDDTGEKALTGADTGIKIPKLNEIDLDAVRRARIVAPLADDLAWATDIARVATEAGARVAIDLEPDAFHLGDAALAELLALTDIAFLNEDSAARFAGDDHDRAAQAVHAYGPSTVVVSRGQAGAYCSVADGPIFRATQTATADVVDTTGAGDALAGAFLAGQLQGHSPAESLQHAVAQATAVVTHIGSRTYLNQPNPHFLNDYPVSVERIR